jgi:hypothetical protein
MQTHTGCIGSNYVPEEAFVPAGYGRWKQEVHKGDDSDVIKVVYSLTMPTMLVFSHLSGLDAALSMAN